MSKILEIIEEWTRRQGFVPATVRLPTQIEQFQKAITSDYSRKRTQNLISNQPANPDSFPRIPRTSRSDPEGEPGPYMMGDQQFDYTEPEQKKIESLSWTDEGGMEMKEDGNFSVPSVEGRKMIAPDNFKLEKLFSENSPFMLFVKTTKNPDVVIADFSQLETLPVKSSYSRYGGKIFFSPKGIESFYYRGKMVHRKDESKEGQKRYLFVESVIKSTLWLLVNTWLEAPLEVDDTAFQQSSFEKFQDLFSLNWLLKNSKLMGFRQSRWSKHVAETYTALSKTRLDNDVYLSELEMKRVVWYLVYRPAFSKFNIYYPYVRKDGQCYCKSMDYQEHCQNLPRFQEPPSNQEMRDYYDHLASPDWPRWHPLYSSNRFKSPFRSCKDKRVTFNLRDDRHGRRGRSKSSSSRSFDF